MSVVFNSLISGSIEAYQIVKSLRLRKSASAYLSKVFSSVGNQQIFTFSGWIKRADITTTQVFFSSYSDASNYLQFRFEASGVIRIVGVSGGVTTVDLSTTGYIFVDPTAHYHVQIGINTTVLGASDRIAVIIDGIPFPVTGTYPAQNSNIRSWTTHTIGQALSSNYSDMYISEVNFLDGIGLVLSNSLGQIDPITGQWTAKKNTNAYGTNGFYLDFSDATSATTLCLDRSGNGNDWTPTNISTTTGATYDSMLDVPLAYGTTDRGNYCTLSSIDALVATGTLNGNLRSYSASDTVAVRGTQAFPATGKWYFEGTKAAVGDAFIGLAPVTTPIAGLYGAGTGFYAYYSGASKYTNGTSTGYGATYDNGDVIGVAVDCDAGTVTFYKNNVSQGTAFTGLDFSTWWKPIFRQAVNVVWEANFGQRPFAYAPPTGFNSLHTGSLTTTTTTLYPHNNYVQVSGSGMSVGPNLNSKMSALNYLDIYKDFGTESWKWRDTVRGLSVMLSSDSIAAETAFTNFTLADTYMGYRWKAGDAVVTNTDGTISSQVCVNVSSGFSIVTYTGTGANATVGHGLGVAPKMVIVKNRDVVGQSWLVWQQSLTGGEYLLLESTAAKAAAATPWNSTVPTSSVLSIGTSAASNGSTNKLVAYCFAEIPGLSKLNSYIGNGSTDGPNLNCGFAPALLLVKRIDVAGDWCLVDNLRGYWTPNGRYSKLNSSAGDTVLVAVNFKANSIKIVTTDTNFNANGGTYIYYAIADGPFKYILAR